MVSEKKKQRWREQWTEPAFQAAMLARLKDQKANPYAYSQLAYWLSLDAWGREEGLQVLAGIEPGTLETDPLDRGAWIDGQPFAEHISFLMVDPVEACAREEFPGDDESYQSYLEAAEHKHDVLTSLQRIYESLLHRLDRTVGGLGDEVKCFQYRPLQFLGWARSIDFKPAWLDWAEANGRVPQAVEPMVAPFFDADADDYPELLHIAVCAWEHARKSTQGTPKQRVLDYLAGRYPKLPQGSRDAIAQVVNWQRMGGRPPRKTENGG